ncbi:MAG: patatin-like phospholipase family protein [Bdellovibrionales bacterium]|nr:patatin-like phospholipase family protein [Bdellovibrionales bacterium]
MRRRPQEPDRKAIQFEAPLQRSEAKLAIVLSGGGSRAAYQAGALRALVPYFERHPKNLSIVIGSSIGAINGLIFSACLKQGYSESVSQLEQLWSMRTFKNTFAGSPSSAFLRAIRMAVLQYMSPGPKPTSDAIFDPTPLMTQVDSVITEAGGLAPNERHPNLEAVAVMTTLEGTERKPLLFLSSHKELAQDMLAGASFQVCAVETLTAKHGFASAALPSVLPPVEIDTQLGKLRLVDGGISQNVPVDPAARLGAERVIICDISGRAFWLDQYNHAHDSRPDWEVPAEHSTFCVRPPETFVIRNRSPFGPILKHAVARSTGRFIEAVGPTWPVFKLLKNRIGEDLAYEVMSYVALDPDYLIGLMEAGYSYTKHLLKSRTQIEFQKNQSFEQIVEEQLAS